MRGRSRSRGILPGRRLALAALLVLGLPVGVAHLAQGTVPTTTAGQDTVDLGAATAASIALDDATVNDAHADSYQFTNMKAALSGPDGPVADATIVFQVAGVTVCTATTHHDGTAICPANAQFDRTLFKPVGADPLTYPYTAHFAGGTLLAPVTGTGHLAKVTGPGASNDH